MVPSCRKPLPGQGESKHNVFGPPSGTRKRRAGLEALRYVF
jgi:hypothetical protein